MWNYERFCVFWRRGGNWSAFVLFWLFASAVIHALEHSEQNKELTLEEESKRDVGVYTGFLKEKKDDFQNDTKLANQLERMIKLMDESPNMPRLWRKIDFELVYGRIWYGSAVEVVRDEFLRIKEGLGKDDISGRELAATFIKLLSEDDTVSAFRLLGEDYEKERENVLADKKENEDKCLEKRNEGQPCEQIWSFWHSVHFTSNLFTTFGRRTKTPITTGGKLATIIFIIIQIPFFLNCIATTAAHMNRMMDTLFGISCKHDDLELELDLDLVDLTTETANSRQRQLVMLKGFIVLASALLIYMVVAGVYLFCTSSWMSFSDVVYFEFICIASVGFGDMDIYGYTLGDGILRNLWNIPAQIATFAMLVRVLPLIS